MRKTYELIALNGTVIIDPNEGIIKAHIGDGDAVLKVEGSMLRGGNEPFHEELQYLALLQELVNKSDADPRDDRTGVGTYSVFGRSFRFNLRDNFPLLTTKRVAFKSVVHELAWMLRGETNVKPLQEAGVTIWDEWADENGELGPVYGKQWRKWQTPARFERDQDNGNLIIDHQNPIDQISELVRGLINNPNSRRHIVTAWNPAEIEDMALPPCHCFFQMYVEDGYLSCQLYQRSADIFLGVPFNIASYALLTALVAKEVGLHPGDFVHTFGDVHLYSNHVEQAKEQLTRTPRPFPRIRLANMCSTFSFEPDDVALLGYDPHPAIKAEVAV